jgi:hypothetical protein
LKEPFDPLCERRSIATNQSRTASLSDVAVKPDGCHERSRKISSLDPFRASLVVPRVLQRRKPRFESSLCRGPRPLQIGHELSDPNA